MTKKSRSPALSVVMVTLNEEEAVAKVVKDIQAAVPEAEIIVVDSSKDRTGEIAAGLGCHVISQKPAKGYGKALMAGLLEAKGDIVVTLDCDDTYPAEDIPRLVKKVSEGYDVVSASRMKDASVGMSQQNYAANWLFAYIARTYCGVETTDVHTGMRAYKRELLHKLEFDSEGMALPVELFLAPAQKGYRCTEIFINYKERIGKTTLRPIPGAIWTLRRLWKHRR